MMQEKKKFALFSTKAYLGSSQLESWLATVAENSRPFESVRTAVLPPFPLIPICLDALRSTAIEVGAQNCAATEDGKQTGEVRASLLAELGCSLVCVGHSERRSKFAESDQIIAAKVQCVIAQDMTPLICVGDNEPLSSMRAATEISRQIQNALPPASNPGFEVIIAYEPIWAIGAQEAASPSFVIDTIAQTREMLPPTLKNIHFIYGGTAGRGTFRDISSVVDGLFLGRRAHDPHEFLDVVNEIATI